MLKDFRNFILKKENYAYIKKELKDENVIDDFLFKTEFITSNKNTFNYDYTMSAGDAIIFNEGGIHKASKTLKNERIVLRFMFHSIR